MSSEPIEILYILGSGFSGSTLLGTILGSHESIFNLGEIKSYSSAFQKHHAKCSCGKKLAECPFWSSIAASGGYPYREPSFKERVILSLRMMLGISYRPVEIRHCKEIETLRTLMLEAKRIKPSTRMLLDNSKHLWRLLHLMKCHGVHVKVIYLIRGIRGNVSSYVKHDVGFWRGLFFRYLFKNFLIKRFLMTNSVEYLEIKYDNLCAHPHQVLNWLGCFLGFEFSKSMLNIGAQELHLPTGNIGTRKQLASGNLEIKFDDSWKDRLTHFQKTILDIVERMRIIPNS